MALLTLLGGVDPDALLGAFAGDGRRGGARVRAGAGLLALGGQDPRGAARARMPSGASGCSAAPMVTHAQRRRSGSSLTVPPRTADPFYLAFAPYWRPGPGRLGDYLGFLGVTAAISAALVGRGGLAAAGGLHPGERRGRPAGGPARFAADAREGRRLASRGLPLPGPSLDCNPVLWREWHRNRPSRWARVVGVLFVALAATFSAIAVVSRSGDHDRRASTAFRSRSACSC